MVSEGVGANTQHSHAHHTDMMAWFWLFTPLGGIATCFFLLCRSPLGDYMLQPPSPGNNNNNNTKTPLELNWHIACFVFSFIVFNVLFQNSSAVSGFVGLSNDGGGLIL